MDDTGVLPPTYKKVFKAHVRAGWTFRKNKRPRSSEGASDIEDQDSRASVSILPPQGQTNPHLKGSKLRAELHAFGLKTNTDAGKLWGVEGSKTPDPGGLGVRANLALWVIMGAVSAARLSASVLLDARWIGPLLGIIQNHIGVLLKALSRQSARKAVKRALEELLGFLGSHCDAASDCLEPHETLLTHPSAVYLCANLDALYYDLLQFFLRSRGEGPPIPPPHDYFPAIAAKHPGNTAVCQKLLSSLSPSVFKSFVMTWELEGDAKAVELPEAAARENPLLAVMWARFKEGSRLLGSIHSEELRSSQRAQKDQRKRKRRDLSSESSSDSDPDFSASDVTGRRWRATRRSWEDASASELSSKDDSSDSSSGDNGEDSVAGNAADNDPEPWPGNPALRAWRESGKECHYYAYAPPTNAALDVLAKYAPLVEVGAGMGYWAGALARRRVSIQAFDIQPPSPGSKTPNEYHGWIPAVHGAVSKGGAGVLKGFPNHSLFLCYPPFGRPMASDCLRNFRGKTLCVVGEVMGDTAEPRFFQELISGWRILERLPLPNWSDSAHELLVWERRTAGLGASKKKRKKAAETSSQALGEGEGIGLADCSGCGKGWSSISGSGDWIRCRWCREIVYCCKRCGEADGERHRQMHLLRWIHREEEHGWRGSDFESFRVG